MTIGQVAKRSGFAASAIRFYEEAGVLPRAARAGGRRIYDVAVLERLAVVERAKACGFSLEETRRLFFGFREGSSPTERWQAMARRKLAELEEMERKIAAKKKLLLSCRCVCKNLGECGRRMLAKKRGERSEAPLPLVAAQSARDIIE